MRDEYISRLTGAWTQGTGACSGYAAVGDGYYNHSGASGYAYDELGSPERMAGRTYVYDLEHPQAVRYAYNYGPEGRFDDFSSAGGWACAGACDRLQVDGEWLRSNGDGNPTAGTSAVYRSDAPALAAGDAIHIEFKVQTLRDGALQLEALDGGGTAAAHAL